MSKNLLGDESLISIVDCMENYPEGCILESIDISSCRIGDDGILYFLESLNNNSTIHTFKVSDNFISEKIEKEIIVILN